MEAYFARDRPGAVLQSCRVPELVLGTLEPPIGERDQVCLEAPDASCRAVEEYILHSWVCRVKKNFRCSLLHRKVSS